MNRHYREPSDPDLWVGVLVFMVFVSIAGLLCVDDVESRTPPSTWEVDK